MGWQAPSFIYPKRPEDPNLVNDFMAGIQNASTTMGSIAKGRGIVKGTIDDEGLQKDFQQNKADADKKIAELEGKPEEQKKSGNFIGNFFGGGKAAGGPVKKNVKYIVGENGAETFIPEQDGVIVPNPASAQEQAPTGPQASFTGVPQITGDKAMMMAGAAPLPAPAEPSAPAPPAPVEAPAEVEKRNKRIEINAEMHGKNIEALYRRGRVKEATEMEGKFLDQTVKLATIDYKTAQNVWNKSFLKNNFGDISFKPVDKFKIVGDHGSFVVFNETTGEARPLESVGELKGLDPTQNVYMKTTDNKGKVTWQQIEFGKPKEEKPTTEEFQVGENTEKRQWNAEKKVWETIPNQGGPKWKGDGTDGTGGAGGKKTAAQTLFDNMIVQNYSEGMVDETGKAPDLNTVMAKFSKSPVKDKMIDGKPVTLQQLHDVGQQYYGAQLETMKPAEALNATTQFMQDYGTTKVAPWNAKIKGDQKEQVANAVTAAKKAGARIGQDQKTGVITAFYGDRKEVLWDGKASVPGKAPAPAKPVAKPVAKPAAKPAAAPVKVTATEKKEDNWGKEVTPKKTPAISDADRIKGAKEKMGAAFKAAKDIAHKTYDATPRAKLESKKKMLMSAGMTEKEAEAAAQKLMVKERNS